MKIDWMYFRNSWTSCRNAREVLDANHIQVANRTDARKEKLEHVAVWNLLQNAKKIRTAKGKKIEMWDPREDSRELILKAAMGPSGNLRAPTVRIKDEFFIGFNPDLYAEICKRM